ncbi:hypothetical protein C0J52_11946 [Blattella germanica]|nr:hypothetical protein C0J52_11946 [Blattella germanica]
MGNCCHPFGLTNGSSKKHKKKVVLLLVGLDNAGKTTTAKSLIGEPADTVVPTVGFSSVSLVHQGSDVMIYDLGGGPQIRGIWHHTSNVHGIIFVVDASDISRLANKQDSEGALDELDIVEKLNLETLVNQQRCPTLVEMCSATQAKNARKKIDPAVHNGFRWLMNCIVRDYKNLNARVEQDVATQRKIDEQERKDRLERILKAKEERGEEVVGNGTCNGEMHEDSDNDVVMADPFKPITEHVNKSAEPVREPDFENRIILVKESPKKVMPNSDDQNSSDKGQKCNDIQSISDIDHEDMILEAKSENKNSLKPEVGDKIWFGSAVSIASPSHSVTGLIKDQLELENMKPKKRPLLRRTNRTAPAPLGSSDQETTALERPEKMVPTFLRKQAFTEQIVIAGDEEYSPRSENNEKKKQSFDRSLFCIRTISASTEQLNNEDPAVEIHMTNSADSKIRKRPLMGKLNLANSKVQPASTETSLSNSINIENFHTSVESDQVTVIKQMSSDSTSLISSGLDLKAQNEPPVVSPIKQWDIDKLSLQNEVSAAEGPLRDISNRQNSAESSSRQNSAPVGDLRLKKQQSVDEASTVSSRSRTDSQQLSDSGFVSPKNVLPPLRPNSSVDRPPWVLPPLSSRSKYSSQDSILESAEINIARRASNENNEDESENTQGGKNRKPL